MKPAIVHLPAAGRARVLFWAGCTCLAVATIGAIASTALGVRVHWTLWLILVANAGCLTSSLLQGAKPAASRFAIVATGVSSLLAAIAILFSRP